MHLCVQRKNGGRCITSTHVYATLNFAASPHLVHYKLIAGSEMPENGKGDYLKEAIFCLPEHAISHVSD